MLEYLFGRSEPKLTEKASLASPDDVLRTLFDAAHSHSGVSVTPATALGCPPVRCAVLAISEQVGQLPLQVYRRTEGGKERAPNHPAYRLLHDDANDHQSASSLRAQLTQDALLHGNGFGLINRVDGRPIELLRLDPAKIDVEADDFGAPRYFMRRAGQRQEFARANILHIRAPGLNGIAGDSPIRQARETIGLLLAIEGHTARLFKNGGRPSGIIAFPNELTAEALAKAKAAWRASNSGENSGGVTPLDNGASFLPIAMNSVDAQLIETWNRLVLDVARVFRVPPTVLMDFGRATWANSEAMRRDFIDFCLRRWLGEWEGQIRLKLIDENDRDTYVAEFLLDDFLKGDTAARMDAYGKAIAARILSPNEARAMENRAPYEGGDRFENPNTTAVPANV
ncbi:MAG: phage portal protein HK97 family [Xanthobacteraceae bacterium]|nr:MAG: phage portal protein HK97 family [Xanthobacteraceae bacterium]